MNNILLITAGPRGEASHSSAVARELADRLAAARPGAVVTHRDLGANPLPHLDGILLTALGAANRNGLSPQVLAAALRADAAIAQLLAADAVVIATSTIDFGMPAELKTWFEHVLRAGVTFRESGNGPQGLVTGRKAYVVMETGGVASDSPLASLDFRAPHLKTLLNLIGITDIEHVAAEAVAFGPQAAGKAEVIAPPVAAAA